MGIARKLDESSPIESLRGYYHSVHDSERTDVIEILGSMADPDAARELVQLYTDCQWRGSRLQIIRVLSKNPTERSLEFLFRLAQSKEDIPITEAAIWSLGQSHHRLAALFLVRLFGQGDESLRPSVVGALGQIPDRTLVKEFLKELPEAIQARKLTLAKNLILTLGELKVKEAIPQLIKVAEDRVYPEIAICALVAIGKIARDPKIIEALESRFRDELFQYQLFTSVKGQVQFRTEWKVEDYLSKLFDGRAFHKTLPFELSHFSPEDVKEGLKLFSESGNFEKLCHALSRIDFPEVANWYTELFDFKKLDEKQIKQVLVSISSHLDARMKEPLSQIRRNFPALTLEWLEAVAMSLPQAEIEFKDFFASLSFREMDESGRILAINHLYHHGLCIQSSAAQLHEVGKILEQTLDSDPSAQVKGRLLRAMGGLRIASKKATILIKECFKEPSAKDHVLLLPSCLKYLELCSDKNLTDSLLELAVPAKLRSGYLKSLSALPTLPKAHEGLETFLKSCLASKSAVECRIDALNLLRQHPRPTLISEVLDCLKGEYRIQIAAIICLKTMGGESAAEPLAKLLESEQESLSGRALDTLTSLPGLRAKRIVIDYLKEHCEDADVCDKVSRCLQPPETPNDYFPKSVDYILERFPQHPQKDSLILLREKLSTQNSIIGPTGTAMRGIDIQAIDLELSEKITGYKDFDESVKTTLRSAELPYKHREMFDEFVDKASVIVEYCKGVDLLMEKRFGKKLLFPKLENSLHEFANALYPLGLNEDYPNAEKVLREMGLEKHFSAQSLPVHKMSMIAQGIRNGRIVNEHFKTLDGLRAWAVMLLLFGRKINGGKALIPLKASTDDQVILFCKRLIALQEIRNPLAHRETEVKFVKLDEVRNEVFALLSSFSKIF